MNKLLPKIPFKRKPKDKAFVSRGEDFKYWKRFEAREKAEVEHAPIHHKSLVGFRYHGRDPHRWYYSEYDPVDNMGKMFNRVRNVKLPIVEPLKRWDYFVGDHVQVLVGKDKGKIGLISKVIKERNWVFVGGMNKRVDRFSPNKIVREAPLIVNHEVKLLDPSDMQQTEVEWRYTEEGDKVRVSARTGRIIPLSQKEEATWEDGVNTSVYQASVKDTSIKDLKEETFVPVNSTFEDDILMKYGEYKRKKKRRTYWY